MLRICAIACLLVSCGPKSLETNPPLAEPSDAPWVAEHRELVDAGCACETSDCFEEARAKIDALVAEHGGLDESPADVHVAHGEFAQCYQGGTSDPVRDLGAVAHRMCGCATEGCVKQSMIARLKFEDKYGAVGDNKELAELDAQYSRCKDERIVSGNALAGHFESVMSVVCSCAASDKCGTRLTDLPPMPAAVLITERSAHEHRITRATEQICNCAKNGGLAGTYGGFDVAARCKPPKS
jgi:hypothetical protein